MIRQVSPTSSPRAIAPETRSPCNAGIPVAKHRSHSREPRPAPPSNQGRFWSKGRILSTLVLAAEAAAVAKVATRCDEGDWRSQAFAVGSSQLEPSFCEARPQSSIVSRLSQSWTRCSASRVRPVSWTPSERPRYRPTALRAATTPRILSMTTRRPQSPSRGATRSRRRRRDS